MGRQSQSAAWSTAVVMGLKVTLGCLLACSVSSVPLDAGYGAPAAPPLILAPHQPAAAPLPLQLVHAAPQPVPLICITMIEKLKKHLKYVCFVYMEYRKSKKTLKM